MSLAISINTATPLALSLAPTNLALPVLRVPSGKGNVS